MAHKQKNIDDTVKALRKLLIDSYVYTFYGGFDAFKHEINRNLKLLQDVLQTDDLKPSYYRELFEVGSLLILRDKFKACEADVRKGFSSSKTVKVIFDEILEMYLQQPKLELRSSTNQIFEQFSTPIPISFLLGLWTTNQYHKPTLSVLEPTAGNGLLLSYFFTPLEKDLKTYELTVNEIEDFRNRLLSFLSDVLLFYNLKHIKSCQVFKKDVFNNDFDSKYDVILINPPFTATKQCLYIDNDMCFKRKDFFVIAKILKHLKPDGRAAIVFHGGVGNNKIVKQEFWNNKGLPKRGEERQFWLWLYENYNVADKFFISGKLWERQGQATNIRIALIDGKRKEKTYPPLYSEKYDTIISSWEDFYNRIMLSIYALKQLHGDYEYWQKWKKDSKSIPYRPKKPKFLPV